MARPAVQDKERPRDVRVRLRDPARVLLPPSEAIGLQLRTLGELRAWREISLWTANGAGHLRCAGHARGRPTAGLAAAARRVHREGEATPPGARRRLVAVPVGADAVVGVLAARLPSGGSGEAIALLQEAAPLLACVLERRHLLDTASRQAELIVTTERRLSRFGLDVHDGPAQEATALLSDLRFFGAQLDTALEDDPRRGLIAGRVQDLQLRAASLERTIRRLAQEAGGSAALEMPLEDAIAGAVQDFVAATGIVPTVDLRGPLDDATVSQRLALLRAVQEALRNVQKHAMARSVRVRAVARARSIEAEIRDDGRGFDVRRTFAAADRRARMGLAGIAARAELLGGRCEIRSRQGGPTTVSLSLPRWSGGRGAPG